jgi:hypothetical protein
MLAFEQSRGVLPHKGFSEVVGRALGNRNGVSASTTGGNAAPLVKPSATKRRQAAARQMHGGV